MGLTLGLAILSTALPSVLPFVIIAVVGLVTFHVTRLYRRLDALMELFDEDIKRATERKDSNDDRVV